MKLENKTPEIKEEIRKIHNEAFSGIERAPDDVLDRFLTHGDVFVDKAFDKGAILGYAVVSYNDAGAPWLWNIAITKFCRGCGIGQSLMDEVVAFLRKQGYKSLRLSVNATNTGAVRFYLWNEFHVSGLRVHYYGPDDGLMMEKSL